ncbi:MAG: ribonuclease III, partial [Treponema sp.]
MPNIDRERKNKLLDFCRRLNLKFKNPELLDMAFHHRSYSNEDIHAKNLNNERLEFLGDSVLGLVAADFLYKDMAENAEGELSKIKSAVVSEKALAPVGLRFGIDEMLVMGHGEELTDGRHKPAILADCMEAVIGAYYLDSGFAAAKKYVLSFLIPEIRKVQKSGGKDYKT